MPYKSNADLPKAVRNSLPEEAQTIWRKATEAAIGEYGDNNKAFATGWAAVRRSGYSKENGIWVKKTETDFVFKMSTAQEDLRLAFGWSVISRDANGNDVWDLQDDGIDPFELEKLAYKYVRFYRDSGELHNGSKGLAVLVESVVTTLEKQKIWGLPSGVMPVGWWTGFYVIDDALWNKVKSGEMQAFSIEGTAVRKKQ